MAYCGAEVIKVESQRWPSVVRLYVSPRAPELGIQPALSPWFTDWDAGKRFVALDLSRPEAVALARRLVSVSDVVVENYSSGVMEKLGLGYAGARPGPARSRVLQQLGLRRHGSVSELRDLGAEHRGHVGARHPLGVPGAPVHVHPVRLSRRAQRAPRPVRRAVRPRPPQPHRRGAAHLALPARGDRGRARAAPHAAARARGGAAAPRQRLAARGAAGLLPVPRRGPLVRDHRRGRRRVAALLRSDRTTGVEDGPAPREPRRAQPSTAARSTRRSRPGRASATPTT